MCVKDTVNGINIRLYIAEEKKNSEHENTAIETVQNQTNCKKK